MTTDRLRRTVSCLTDVGIRARSFRLERRSDGPRLVAVPDHGEVHSGEARTVVLAEHQNFLAFISVNEAWSEEAAAEAEEMVLDAASAAEKLDPSPRLWDLTVMVLIAGKIRRGQMSSAMSWATSTRYARRLIVDGIDFDEDDDLRRALAPLLPLSLERSADSSLDLRRSLRERLSRVVGADLATTAVESFFDSGRIELR